MAYLLWFAFAIFGIPLSEGAKILVVFPFPTKSHNILGEGFCRILLKAGHEVTYITAFPKKYSPPNLRYIDVSKNVDALPSSQSNLKSLIDKEVGINDVKNFFTFLLDIANSTFKNENVEKIMNNPDEKFDLVLIEWLFSDVYSGLAAVYDCPYIWFSSVDPHSMVLRLIDETLNPAYNPNSISSNVPPFTFVQRVQELFSQIFMALLSEFYLFPNQRHCYEEIFGPIVAKKNRPLPSLDEIRYNASLMLGNSDISVGKATRLPQNYKAIGGYHIDPKVEPLPENLKKIMDSAQNGVVYFSMGSNLKSKELPDEIKKDLLKTFGELKYTVIWKFEEELPNLPKNVHILQWAPQPSILAHPKCKLFITHGGLLSTLEAVHFGVPIIGIPVLADQYINVDLAVKKGFALRMDLSYNLADDLKVAIKDIMTNIRFKEKITELNLLFHDRPVPPHAEVAHWVNHVIRTKGALHLRSPALMMPWYQKMYLDLLALVTVAIFILVKIIKICCARKKTTTMGSKKRN